MRRKIARIRIPLDALTTEQKEDLDRFEGKYIIVTVDEPCLTCGSKKRVQHIERTDGKREIVQECIYCNVVHHTSTNKSGK